MSTSTPSASAVSPVATSDDKTVAIISYLTIIGFIAAIVMHGSKKNGLGSYHLRQSLGLMVTSVAMLIVGTVLGFVPFLGWFIDLALWFGIMVLWFIGFIAAVNGRCAPVPLVGEHFQKWFAGAFE